MWIAISIKAPSEENNWFPKNQKKNWRDLVKKYDYVRQDINQLKNNHQKS